MELLLASPAFVVVALAVAVMGFAIQRGATCTVAAVDKLLTSRRATRLVALVEASLWVAGGLVLAHQLHWLGQPPGGYALSGWTVFGAALLGLGAFVNRACVFGAIARIGSGEWAYLATPLGFYLGCLSVAAVFGPTAPRALPAGSVVVDAWGWLLWPLLALAAWRMVAATLAQLRAGGAGATASRLWSPHVATLVIGITFLVTLLLAGAWAYTDVLAELARGMAHDLAGRLLLAFALLLGALVGGWTAGRLRLVPVSARALARCFAGGVLMGWGSLLIPGGNDGLILVGMPLLWPYAWAAFLTMCLTVAAAQLLQRRIAPPG